MLHRHRRPSSEILTILLLVTCLSCKAYCIAQAAECDPIPSSLCSDILPYKVTYFPNNHAVSVAEAEAILYNISESLDCHEGAMLYFCTNLFPECSVQSITRVPCRALCNNVNVDCPNVVRNDNLGYDLTNCDLYPDLQSTDDLCIIPEGDVFGDGICGKQPPFQRNRVFNGRDAVLGAWPWHGRMVNSNTGYFACNMELIDAEWGITAAHCLSHVELSYSNGFTIFGDVDNIESSPHAQRADYDWVYIHPDYGSPQSLANDIALVHFVNPVNITDYVSPICLTRVNTEIDTFENCWATGWGFVRPYYTFDDLPRYLQEMRYFFETPDQCRTRRLLLDTELCGSPETSLCSGDSGGPVSCLGEDNRWHIVGVLSWANPWHCGISTSGHVRVSNYTDTFIHEAIIRFQDCSPGYLCNDGSTCVLKEKICDGYVDCPNMDDEIHKCSTAFLSSCANVTCLNGGECIDNNSTAEGFTCLCPNGWKGEVCQTIDCGDRKIYIQEGDSINITSPLYPQNYPNGHRCYWTVNVPDGLHIQVLFEDFSLEAGYDFLILGDEYFFGTNTPNNLTYPMSVLNLTFWPDGAVTERGFSIQLSPINGTEVNECLLSPCEHDGTCIDTPTGYTCSCTDDYYGFTCHRENLCGSTGRIPIHVQPDSSFNISSFKYPSYHPDRVIHVCEWLLIAAPDRRVLVTIVDVEISSIDALLLGNEAVMNTQNSGVREFISEDNSLHINFASVGWTADKRWLLTISDYVVPDSDECSSQPCRNGGRCMEEINGFKCKCRRGYTGRVCQINKRRCGNSFVCDNGRCVSPFFVCDGKNHCGDNSDEFKCDCEFDCYNGRCIPLRYVCDGNNNCKDWTDEVTPICN